MLIKYIDYALVEFKDGVDVDVDGKTALAQHIINNLSHLGNNAQNFKLTMFETYTEIKPSDFYWNNNNGKAKLIVWMCNIKKSSYENIVKLPTWYLSQNWDGDRFAGKFEIRTNYIDVVVE